MHISRSANIVGALAVAVFDQIPEDRGRAVPMAALVHLSHCRRPTIESLRRVMRLSHSATVRLADRLEAAGFVSRNADHADARAVRLRITEKGLEQVDRFLGRRDELVRQMLDAALDPEEQLAFATLAGRVLAAATNSSDDLYRICRLCDFSACRECPVAETRTA